MWDLGTCREVYRGKPGGVLWDPHGAWVISKGADGLFRVPVLARSSGREEPPAIPFGQPRPLFGLQEDVRDHGMTWVGPEGRRLVLTGPFDARELRSRVQLLELDAETIRILWERKLNASSLAASPDGRWVAVGSYGGGSGVSVWEADTGRLVGELPVGDARLAFSADGRRLYTTTGRLSPRGAECRSWWVGSWEPDRALPLKRTSHSPAGLAVAADGTVAVVFTMSDMRLLDPETLEEVATLSAPEPGSLAGGAFSPDGTTLATSATETVQLWDLQRLHRGLRAIGLDWDAPAPADH